VIGSKARVTTDKQTHIAPNVSLVGAHCRLTMGLMTFDPGFATLVVVLAVVLRRRKEGNEERTEQ